MKFFFSFIAIALLSSFSFSARAEDPLALEWVRAVDMLRFEMIRRDLPVELLSKIDAENFEYNHRAARAKLMNILWPSHKFPSYTDRVSMARARKFLRENKDRLLFTEQATGVPPRFVTAILLVETQFSVYPAKYKVGDAVFSLAALVDEEFAKLVFEKLKKEDGDRKGFSKIDWKKRSRKIGDRWLQELEAILLLSEVLDLDLESTKGSWAGAIGYAQALPSTLLRNIRNKKGHYLVVNPWDWNDSMLVAARHLQENGWPEDENAKAIDKAILGYNQSKGYLREVKKVAKRLEGLEASLRKSDPTS